jgi:uncharacterized protein (DUF433 family)
METDYISRDPVITSGALCFEGTRVPVQNLFDYLEGSSSLEEFLEDFPSVLREAALAVLQAPESNIASATECQSAGNCTRWNCPETPTVNHFKTRHGLI